MSLRKKIVIAAAAVLVLTLGAYSTLAYLTADVTAHNVITSGNVTIELLDKTIQPGQSADSKDQVYQLTNFTLAYQGGMPVMPGTKASKIVAVSKDGPDPETGVWRTSADCWVRVKLVQTLKDGDVDVWDAINKEGDISFNINEDDWVYQDGWYYYKNILTDEGAGNDQTTPLFTEVNFSGPGIGNEYVGLTYAVDVYAQAVQSANNNPAGGVLNVNGWPADPTAPQA